MFYASHQDHRIAHLRIGAVAKATELSTSTIRWYEDLGLLLPQREASGYRLYSLGDVQWLLKLQRNISPTPLGPRQLARFFAWLPLKELRTRELGEPCRIAAKQGVCWSKNTAPKLSRICRSCPAYEKKHLALDFERYFRAELLATEAK